MPVTINGTNGISGVDGLATSPAVQGTDTNTGVFFPAADQVGIAANGSQVINIAAAGATVTGTLNSSGNVNIGTTGVAAKLYVAGNAASNISAIGNTSGTITLDLGTANNFSLTLNANSSNTLANPSNLTPGQSGVIFVTQDATGSRTLAYGTSWDFTNSTAPTLSVTANAVDVIAYVVRSSTSIAAQFIANIG